MVNGSEVLISSTFCEHNADQGILKVANGHDVSLYGVTGVAILHSTAASEEPSLPFVPSNDDGNQIALWALRQQQHSQIFAAIMANGTMFGTLTADAALTSSPK